MTVASNSTDEIHPILRGGYLGILFGRETNEAWIRRARVKEFRDRGNWHRMTVSGPAGPREDY
jgi:hypothetical protein